jgi:hypothetical protein
MVLSSKIQTQETKLDWPIPMPKKTKANRPNIDANQVRARSIELVDGKGKTKMRFATSPETTTKQALTVIQLYGTDGLPKLELQVSDNAPGIRLTCATNHIGFTVSLNETSHGLSIMDKKGQPAVQIGLYQADAGVNPLDSKPSIVLTDFEDSTESLVVAVQECKIIQPRKKRTYRKQRAKALD